MRWAGNLARIGAEEVHTGFWLGTWRKETTRKTRRRWEDNIKMDLREVGRGMDWIALAPVRDRWRAVVNAVMNLRVT